MFVTFRRFLIMAALAGLSSTSVWANTEPRLALIIGNATYKSSPLNNPVNDARLMEKVLKDAGFTTIKAENASIREMRRLVRDFGDRLKASGGVGLFYFAGHGVQVRGENFLVSTDSDILNEDEVADDSVNVNVILEKMQTAKNRMNLIILDACRNNPFASKSRSALSGLAAINAPSGSLVAYSTAPGSVASDGKGQSGLYTVHLAKAIAQPGLPVEEVFKQVRTAVRKDSNFQQTPWENTALEGAFFFKAPLPVVVSAPQSPSNTKPEPIAAQSSKPDPVLIDMAFWENVKTSQRTGELQAYLTQFPSGVFAVLARMRIDEIKQLATTAQTSAVIKTPDGGLGSLVTTDTLTGNKTILTVTAADSAANWTAYSTGDIVGKDGKILQVRVGDAVLSVTSGQLWTLPLKETSSGEATVRLLNGGYGEIKWKSTPISGGRFRIDAIVSYDPVGGPFGRFFGNWTVTYSSQGDLPETSSTVIRSRNSSNMVSMEYKRG